MLIIWGVIIGVAILVELFTTDFVTVWFAVGAIIAIILAACNVPEYWQVPVFFVVSLASVIGLRPIVKKFIKVDKTPTNADALVGMKVKLLEDCVEGRSSVKINGVIWTAACAGGCECKEGDSVEIIGLEGNKLMIKKEEEK
jgi:membrane protein implicated in regulation of membrane protease activity